MMKQECPIAITPGEWFGPSYKDHVRVTTCPTLATLQKGLAQLGVYVAEIKAGL